MDFRTAINHITALIEGVERLNPHQARLALQQLEAFLTQQHNQIVQLQGVINGHLAQINNLNQVNNNHLAMIEQLKTQLNNLKTENDNLNQELTRLRNKDNTLVEEIARRIGDGLALRLTNQINEKFNQLSQNLLNNNNAAANSQQIVQQLTVVINGLRDQIFQRIDDRYNSTNHEIQELKNTLNSVMQRLDEINTSLRDLKILQEEHSRETRNIQNYLIGLRNEIIDHFESSDERFLRHINNARNHFDTVIVNHQAAILSTIQTNHNALLNAINSINSCRCNEPRRCDCSPSPSPPPPPRRPSNSHDSNNSPCEYIRALFTDCWFYREQFCMVLLFLIIAFFVLLFSCLCRYLLTCCSGDD